MLLSQKLYLESNCFDGMDVLLKTAARHGGEYVGMGMFEPAVKLILGILDLPAVHSVLEGLVEGGQLGPLLRNFKEAKASSSPSLHLAELRIAVLCTLQPNDRRGLKLAYRELDLQHEMANALETRADEVVSHWKEGLSWRRMQSDEESGTEELLEAMNYFCEASDAWMKAGCGHRAGHCAAQASLMALQIGLPDTVWVGLPQTAARRLMEQQQRFAEAIAVAQAYSLENLEDWTPVLWAQLLQPRRAGEFLRDFTRTLPLPSKELLELAQLYRAEVGARGESARWLGSSFRVLLQRVTNVEVRLQMATVGRDFPDVLEDCLQRLDRVPDTAGPLILRRGHGGAYMPLM